MPWYPVILQNNRQSNLLPPKCWPITDVVWPLSTSMAISIANEEYNSNEAFGDITNSDGEYQFTVFLVGKEKRCRQLYEYKLC